MFCDERYLGIISEVTDAMRAVLPTSVRGLVHSDGCRVVNRVNGTPYPRYDFANRSADIRALFGEACDRLGVAWRQNNRHSLSVARRASVAVLDEHVGSKY